jgi:hypothetical protein
MMNEPAISTIETSPEPGRPFHWSSFLVIVLMGVGLLAFWGGSVAMLFGGFVTLFNPITNSFDTASLFSYAIAGFLIGGLLLPALVFGIQRLSGRQQINSRLLDGRLKKLPLWGLLLAYAVLIVAGTFLIRLEDVVWLTMPLINVLSLTLPVLIFAKLGLNGLRGGSLQNTWSSFSISLVFSPFVIFVIEIVTILIGLGLIGVAGELWFPEQMGGLIEKFYQMAQASPAEIENFAAELFQYPAVIAIVLVFLSIFVPVIEELLKPTALWLRANQPITLQQGWFLGLLGGAGFALLENLGNGTVSSDWTFITLARFGATSLHMFNSGLIGYTYALARKEKRVLRLVLAVLATFAIHGAWNGIIIFANRYAMNNPDNIWPLSYLAVLAGIAILLTGGVIVMNKKLQPSAENELPENEFER